MSTSYLADAQLITSYEKNKNVTATYPEVIAHYQTLVAKYDQAKLLTYGLTDMGKPLHLLVLSKSKVFDPIQIRKQNKRILLINNGIHPGEPEGIDASMMLARDLLQKKQLPDDVVICIIPMYNIAGSFNRGVSRINQNGPESYGFRGNYQNLDLNRDFIKTDSPNSGSFQEIFNIWQPEVMVDNHSSNGADYQYAMTLIQTQKDKLHPVLSSYMTQQMVPYLYQQMEKSGYEMIPYVNSVEETPDGGIEGFLETARYSSGYAALHNTIAFMPETHMLKPYHQRVEGTYHFMEHMIKVVQRDARLIGENKKLADEQVREAKTFALNWKLDRSQWQDIPFKGFEAKYKPSELSGFNRLYYDRNAPYQKNIKLWDHYVPAISAEKPLAYVIPQSWQKVISLLKLNRVEMKRLKTDTELELDMYYIADFKNTPAPFEGHYVHSQVKLDTIKQKVKFYKGDYVVYVNQAQNRYIVETLEPQGVDSFFAWNFFDSVLGQKEHYSAYVFEDEAPRLLQQNPALAEKLEAEKRKNPELAQSGRAQLDWVYRQSPYYEKTHRRYPVGRLVHQVKLDLE